MNIETELKCWTTKKIPQKTETAAMMDRSMDGPISTSFLFLYGWISTYYYYYYCQELQGLKWEGNVRAAGHFPWAEELPKKIATKKMF